MYWKVILYLTYYFAFVYSAYSAYWLIYFCILCMLHIPHILHIFHKTNLLRCLFIYFNNCLDPHHMPVTQLFTYHHLHLSLQSFICIFIYIIFQNILQIFIIFCIFYICNIMQNKMQNLQNIMQSIEFTNQMHPAPLMICKYPVSICQ